MKPTTRVLLGLASGAAIGLTLAWSNPALAAKVAAFVQPVGKLWLNALRRAYPEAEALYQAVRPLPTAAAVESVLRQASGRSGGAGAAMQR